MAEAAAETPSAPIAATPAPAPAAPVRGVGAKIPALKLDFGFPPKKIDMTKRCKGKKIIMVGLPGAFTPT
jgi:hypothetical protein